MAEKSEAPNRWTFLNRGLHWRCPECGVSPVFTPVREVRSLSQWMHPLHGCPRCGYAYEREPGYFLISIWAVNYGVIGGLGVAALFLVDSLFHPPLWETMCLVLPAIPVCNFLFIRHAKALFLAMDHYLDPQASAGGFETDEVVKLSNTACASFVCHGQPAVGCPCDRE